MEQIIEYMKKSSLANGLTIQLIINVNGNDTTYTLEENGDVAYETKDLIDLACWLKAYVS